MESGVTSARSSQLPSPPAACFAAASALLPPPRFPASPPGTAAECAARCAAAARQPWGFLSAHRRARFARRLAAPAQPATLAACSPCPSGKPSSAVRLMAGLPPFRMLHASGSGHPLLFRNRHSAPRASHCVFRLHLALSGFVVQYRPAPSPPFSALPLRLASSIFPFITSCPAFAVCLLPVCELLCLDLQRGFSSPVRSC